MTKTITTAFQAIASGEHNEVARNISDYYESDHKQIAFKLIESGHGVLVINNIGQFVGLDKDVANAFIQAGQGALVAQNIGGFPEEEHNEIAIALFLNGNGQEVLSVFSRFKQLKADFAEVLIQAGQHQTVINNLKRFEGIDQLDTAMYFIAWGHQRLVGQGIENFDDEFHRVIAKTLIDSGDGWLVSSRINKFNGASLLNAEDVKNGSALPIIQIESQDPNGEPEIFDLSNYLETSEPTRPTNRPVATVVDTGTPLDMRLVVHPEVPHAGPGQGRAPITRT